MEKIQTQNAPKAVGPYSQAVVHNDLVFCSGQISIDPKTNELNLGTIEEQTELVINNLKAVLETSGSSLNNSLKVTVYLKDMGHFPVVNQIYANYFTNKPARACIEVGRLPKDVLIEMDAVAYK